MPYIGRDLNRGNYLKLDDISSSFDSSTTTFNLTVGGSAFTPGSAFSILVSVGGVIQEPESAYQVNNSEITFANAPTAQDSFFCIALGVSLGIGVPGNGTVNGTQLAKPFSYDGYFDLDSTNNRVGINSSTPTVALDVIGDIKLNGNLITGGSGGGNFGIVTCTGLDVNGNGDVSGNFVIGGDLTVNGTTTTLDTNLTEVDKVEVAANNSTVGVAITQSGSGDILRLYDGTSQVVTVLDTGEVGINTTTPDTQLEVFGGSTSIQVGNQSGLGRFGADGTSTKIGSHSNHPLDLFTNGAANTRLRIANNSAATSIGGSNVFNAMLTVQGDISGELFRLKATEGTSRLMVSGTNTNGVEMNLYDEAGGQKGILGVSGTEFFIKAPNSSVPMTFYTNDGSSIGERLRITSSGNLEIINNNDYLKIGSGGPLAMVHTGGEAFITNSTGHLTHRCGVHKWENVDGTAEYFRIASNGQITQTAASGDTILTLKRSNTNTTGTVGAINFAANDGHSVASIQARGDGDNEGAHIQFYTTSAAAGDMYNAASVERLRIDSSGDITAVNSTAGTTTGVTLKVGANASSGTNSGTIIINNGGQGNASLQFDYENSAARAKIYTYKSTNDIIFDTSGTEKVRFTSGGRVAIGTDNPQTILHISDNVPTIRFTDENSTGVPDCEIGGAGGNIDISADINSEKSDSVIRFNIDGGEKLRIGAGGTVTTSYQIVNATAPDFPFVISQVDPSNTVNQLGGSGVGLVFKPATNSIAKIGAGIAAIKPGGNDDETDTDLAFYVSQNDETLDERLRIKKNGDLQFNSASQQIHLNTSDGNDNGYLNIGAAGAANNQNRGAQAVFYGNEHSSYPGQCGLLAGNSGNAAGYIYFKTAGTERIRINTNGTTDFYGDSTGTEQVRIQSSGGGAGIFIANFQGLDAGDASSRLGVGKNDNALIFMNASGSQVQNFAIGTTDAVPLVFSTGNAQRIKIKGDGKVILGNVSNTGGVSNSTLHIESAGFNIESNYDTDDSQGSAPHLTLSGQSVRVRLDMGTQTVAPYAGWIQARFDNDPFNGGTSNSGYEPLLLNPKGGPLGINCHDGDALNNIGNGSTNSVGGIVIRAGRAINPAVNNASTAIKIFPGEVRQYSGTGNVGEQNQGTKYGGIAWNVLDPQNGSWGANYTGHHCWMGMSIHSVPGQELSNWQVQMNSNDAGGSFATNVAIQANPEGWVTTPNNPTFCAIKDNNHYYFTSGQRTVITGWTERHDTHLDFDPSTGVFTAPIAGTYFMYCSVMQDRNDAGDFQLAIFRNTTMFVNSNDLSNYQSSSVIFQQTTVNAIVELSKNDTVDFRGYNSNGTSSFIYKSSYTHCGGYLIG